MALGGILGNVATGLISGLTGGGNGGGGGGVSESQQAALDRLDEVLTQALNASTESASIQADKNTARKIVDGAAVR